MQQDFSVQTFSLLKQGEFYSNIKITPPKLQTGMKRNPVAIICVLDISGSMDCEATQGQSKQSDGFSRLDLVKHSVNTIIYSLEENDVLGVVTFSDQARVDFQPTNMTKEGKQKALTMIKNMKTQGSTNLWAGIKNGLQISKENICSDKNTFVVVLSDGEPNSHPPGGQLKACEDYIKQHPLTCNLNMFGYGYSLNTPLLTSITQLGGGCYGYIPDCSMVGTIFVNFLSHALSSFNSLMQLEIRTISSTAKFNSLNGTNKQKVLLGSNQFGSSRNCLVKYTDVKDGEQIAQIVIRYGKNMRNQLAVKLTATNLLVTQQQVKPIKIQRSRFDYIVFLENAIQLSRQGNVAQAKKQQLQLVAKMQSLNEKINDPYLQSMINDMQSKIDTQGQVGKALENKQWWNKWGKHYLPALKIAHNIEMCTNFKDPGLQSYASQIFRQNQSKIDTIFIKLPPPTPTIKKYDAQGNVHQVQNMGNYYNRYGGCIHGDCVVQMSNCEKRKVSQLKKGDIIKTHKGDSMINCVLITKVEEEIQMVKFESGLIITNYHPILYQNEWKFPIDIKQSTKIYVKQYYNFILESGHSLLINDIYCISLGHGYKNDKVLQHEYLGTDKIIQDLKKVRGYQNGIIIFENKECMKRDPVTNKIVGIIIQA